MELSRQERLILSLQLRILEKLEPKEAAALSRQREAIESGYELEYAEVARHIDEETLSRDECKFVYEVLAMFDALQRAHKTLPDGAGLKVSDVTFDGFDGNNETEHMAYAQYIVEHKGQFVSLAKTPDINSHMPIIDVYRRMVDAWNFSPTKYELTGADVKRIIVARTHPEHR